LKNAQDVRFSAHGRIGQKCMTKFETTRWSLVFAARELDPEASAEALGALCQLYRPAVFAYVQRFCHDRADAEDLTQGFFEHLLVKRLDAVADPGRGRFRHFLRTAVTHFVYNHFAAGNAERRRPNFDESLIAEHAPSAEAAFESSWVLTLLEQAKALLKKEAHAAGKATLFEAVQGFLWEPAEKSDYSEIAGRLQMRSNSVAVSVHRLKVRYRELVRAQVAETVSDPNDINLELRELRSLAQ
jgi:RNA polymerase sigma factor (sigma-70 family)